MMINLVYHALLEPDPDGGFLVTFPDVPDAVTGGDDRAQALDNAEDALAVALLGRVLDGAPLPPATVQGNQFVPVHLRAQNAAKLSVCETFRQSGLTKVALAKRLGKDEAEVRRILNPEHATKLPALEATLRALGYRLVVSTEAA